MNIVLYILVFFIIFVALGFVYDRDRLKRYFIHIDKNKILEEDALKFIFDCEYRAALCTNSDISANLNIDLLHTQRLLEEMAAKKLLLKSEGHFILSEKGREQALKIIRIHRIYERYLAETTGENENNWHEKADFEEHFISIEDANDLAATIGNPVYDPHGDPIPTVSGYMPGHKGKSLIEGGKGENLSIIHVEDEPVRIFKQLTNLGLYPGINIYIEDFDADGYRLFVNGKSVHIDNSLAANITVLEIEVDVKDSKYLRLSEMKRGQKAKILELSPEARGLERRRFLDLGLVRGNTISVVLDSPLGNLRAYEILDTKIALRQNQAQKIFVQIIE